MASSNKSDHMVLDDEVAESTAMVQALAITGCPSASAMSLAIAKKPRVIADQLMGDDTCTSDLAKLATEKAGEEPGTAAFLAGVGIRKVDASLRFLEWQTRNDQNDTTGYIDFVRKIMEKLGSDMTQIAKTVMDDMHKKLQDLKDEEERRFQAELAARKARAAAKGCSADDSD
ncbi:hypothetical protein B0T21DRAFT_408022 [Apiosordaria backusii]|uniref:Uncharacterized protein n=1 Tax=Apiosordaria backusii TaxID=314023 RepID=A0AA40ET42_9PEZI|nr:hypothetical protein B0T21DRAFT_408022 [Apiosordaria backusii]